MGNLERVGYDDASESELFVLEMVTLEDLPQDVWLQTQRFVCLIAWDAHNASADHIATFARQLLDRGAAYVCAWGSDCERVHDIIDRERIGRSPSEFPDSVVITTWHDKETLAEAIFLALTACPDECFEQNCGSTLAVVIGSSSWATEIRAAFSRPREFIRELLSAM
jgi:hypothetical protein